MQTSAILLAGGAGKRMGASVNKQFLLIDNKPMIVHTMQAFQDCRAVDTIYLVVNKNDLHAMEKEILAQYHFSKLAKVVTGGELRQDSVRNGLNAIEPPCDIVIIHDGARPFVSPSFVEKSVALMDDFDAIIPALPVQDTIKEVSDEGFVLKTMERDSLRRIQTPQLFKYHLIMKAYKEAAAKDLRGYDDATFVEHLGIKVKVIEGSPYNLKITTPEDLTIAGAFLPQFKDSP